MRGEIIAIGDELITGRVQESNAGYAAGRLWAQGIEVGSVVMVGDEPGAIAEALSRAVARADFVLVTGGLGATEDDITSGVAAEVFGLPLAESERMVANLRAFFEARGATLSEAARRMANLPLGAEVLSRYSAGFKLTTPEGRPVYFLPGVPAEMRHLTDKKVLPDLGRLAGESGVVLSHELRLFGLPESQAGVRLEGLTDGRPGVKVGFYPVFPEVHILITGRAGDQDAAAELVAEAVAEADKRLAPFVVARGGLTLEETVGALLAGKGLRLALAESCTGGLIGHRITQVAGSSDFFERGLVVYSNRAKEELLGVKPETLEKYGAVSEQTAREMARGAAREAGVEVGLAVTGIAGPSGGSEEKPVGTVHFAVAVNDEVTWDQCRFLGTRRMVKAQSAEKALVMLAQALGQHDQGQALG